jgi:hypothetical protein
VLSEPAPNALVYEFGESSINLAVHFWHEATIMGMWLTRDPPPTRSSGPSTRME